MKHDEPIRLPEQLSEKFIKKTAQKVGLSPEDTGLILRKFVGYCFRQKGGDYSISITPKVIREVHRRKMQLIEAAAKKEKYKNLNNE